MNVYMFQAALYCEDCGNAIREQLTAEGKAPEDADDEGSYDSDDFPKGPFPDGGGEADSVQHCDAHGDCLNGETVTFSGGIVRKIGTMLENDLTDEGVKSIEEAMRDHENNPVTRMHYEFYRDFYDIKNPADDTEEE